VPEAATTLTPAPRARVQAMKEYHPPLGSRDALRLDFNENTLACSPKVREALAAISAGSLTRYPEREPVEAVVADHLCLAADMVALTNGVDEAIHVLFETFLEAGDELLLPVPTYTMYEVYASATDARAVTVQAGDDLQFPFERLLAANHAADQDHRHRQSQQPVGLRGHACTASSDCKERAARSCPRG
jgi:histidinol-phosphate aminotransferase